MQTRSEFNGIIYLELPQDDACDLLYILHQLREHKMWLVDFADGNPVTHGVRWCRLLAEQLDKNPRVHDGEPPDPDDELLRTITFRMKNK